MLPERRGSREARSPTRCPCSQWPPITLEAGDPSAIERGIADAGLEFGSLTAKELGVVQTAADEGAREGARQAAERVIEDRRKAEVARLRKRLQELSG